MRYELNQKVWTIGLVLVNKENNKPVFPFGFLRPYPDQFSITDMFFNELTVVEHHKVSGEWSDEKEYDGFILKDAKDRVWYNQYPKASYGQVSDDADGLFSSPLFDEMFKDSENSGKKLDWDEACVQFNQTHKATINQYSLIRFMNDLAGGILDENGATKIELHDIWPKIKEIQDRVVESFNKATGKKLETFVEDFGGRNKVVRFRRWHIVE